jgi:hypothetical protein
MTSLAFAFIIAAMTQASVPPPAPPTLQSVTAPTTNNGVRPRIFRVYATADGESHIETVEVAATATPLPLDNLRAVSYSPAKVEWHLAPARQFAINLTGEIEAEVSDGTKQRIGPGDLVFLEDTTGKGHITRLLSPVTALFIVPDEGFDLRAWAAGKTAAK